MRRFMKAIKAENLNALAVHIAEYQQRRSAVFAKGTIFYLESQTAGFNSAKYSVQSTRAM